MTELDALRDQIVADGWAGLFVRHGNEERRSGVPGIRISHSPYLVLGERDQLALGIYTGEIELQGDRASVIRMMRAAKPVLWRNELANAALTMPIPDHVFVGTDNQWPLMWWTFSGSVPLATEGAANGDFIEAILVIRHPSGALEFDGICTVGGRMLMTRLASVKIGDQLPSDDLMGNACMALLFFMDSPLLTSTQEMRASRAERRRVSNSTEPDVAFIDLRRPSSDWARDGEEVESHYNVRWIVSGHFRAQWYPSLKGHKLRWIEPYVKGPAGAPLKPSVFRVVR